jgi:hypothetical protein
MAVRERLVTKRANLRINTSARLRNDNVYARVRSCEVSGDEMDPTTRATRDAGVRPKVVCLQKYDLVDKSAFSWPRSRRILKACATYALAALQLGVPRGNPSSELRTAPSSHGRAPSFAQRRRFAIGSTRCELHGPTR